MSGGWIPITKALMRDLPRDRPFTRLEAMFSLTIDYDQQNLVTVRGYAVLWRWSRGKVERFLEEIGVAIGYPEETRKKQNQGGPLVIPRPSHERATGGQIKMIDSKWLSNKTSHPRAASGPEASHRQGTTNKPNPEPKPEPLKPLRSKPGKPASDSPLFAQFWKAYPKKKAKLVAQKAWSRINPDEHILAGMLSALEQQKRSVDWQKDRGQYIPLPASWLSGRRWEDEEAAMVTEDDPYADQYFDFCDPNRTSALGSHHSDKEGGNEG